MEIKLIEDVIKYFVSASAITTAIVYVIKKLFDTYIATRLEKVKKRIQMQSDLESRTRTEITRWANPILSSINGLIGRLEHIIKYGGYTELHKNNPQYIYYMPSTLYYFSQYLCWVQILKEEINYEIFNGDVEEKHFFTSIKLVNKALREYETSLEPSKRASPVYSLQQRQIAEMMISNENGKRCCMSYFIFEQKYQEEKIQIILTPLSELLQDLNNETLEGTRLKKVLNSLYVAKKEVQKIIKVQDS